MKLAICTTGELYGGVERQVVGMTTWWLRRGNRPLVILFHDRELAKQLREIGLEPVILKSRGSLDVGVVKTLGIILAEHGVDVVHAHGYRAVVNCALARRHCPFAMVRTVHGLEESGGWWTWSGFKSHMYIRLERYFGRRSGAAVVYVTEDLRRRHARFDRGLVTKTIHNGIDPLDPGDHPRPDDLEPGRFNLAAVGRVSRVKGLGYAVRAVAELDQSSDVVLNIIGTGPLTGELKDLAAGLGVQDRVRFLGFKKNVYDYMAHCDALVMPSLHEGLPYTILEAMSLGLPIIANRVGGLAEVLEQGLTAEFIDVTNCGDMVEAITRLKRGGGQMSRAGRKIQREIHDLDAMCAAYVEVYEDLLA